MHALVFCPMARDVWVWQGYDVHDLFTPSYEVDFADWWQTVSSRLPDMELCKVGAICWGIWNLRNERVFA